MSNRISLKRIYYSVYLILGVSLIGVLGFVMIEGYSLIDAMYMTAITMSTVGFGLVQDLSAQGKAFSIFLIVISAGTFVYGITTITTFVVEGEIRDVFSKYRIQHKVEKLRDHTIICGLGRNGKEAAIELIWQKQKFVIIEEDHEIIEVFQAEYDCLIVEGDATREEILEKANIKEASGLVSTLSSDAENVFITLTAREMNPTLKIVSRASSEATISKLKRAGANKVILPHIMGGRRMANLITRPALVEFIDTITGQGNPDMHIEDVECIQHPKLVGKTLSELKIRTRTGVAVIGMKKENRRLEMNINANTVLESGDQLYILGNSEQLRDFHELYLSP
ncbi:MAG: potassium channel protein [Bacteroidota bacterium]